MNADGNNLIELGAHKRMTPLEALDLTKRESPPEVLILFMDNEGDLGLRSSNMSNKDALWLIEMAKKMILDEVIEE